MKAARSKDGQALKAAANQGAIAQQKRAAPPSSPPPRPDLLPARMRGAAAQAKPVRLAAGARSGAPQPELLPPQMRPTSTGATRRVEQARTSNGTRTGLTPAGPLRVNVARELCSGELHPIGVAQARRASSRLGALRPELLPIQMREMLGRPGTVSTAVQRMTETSSESDNVDMSSLLDDPEFDDESSGNQREFTPDFWKGLMEANGVNRLGSIILDGVLGRNECRQGEWHVGARLLVGDDIPGYALSAKSEYFEGSVRVYWLPYKNAEIVAAERSEFENSYDYFMTVQLSGCRFTLTDSWVLHTASDVRSAGELDSELRDKAEQKFRVEARKKPIKDARFIRRLSINDKSKSKFSYYSRKGGELNGKALVFGMRTDSGWVYKALTYTIASAGGGTWVVLHPS